MSKHTPGSWVAKGRNIVTSRETVFTGAVAYAYGEDDNGQDEDECLANARLIAAAPDLLAALIRMVDVNQALLVRSGQGIDDTQAKAAIAKAEGREPEEPNP